MKRAAAALVLSMLIPSCEEETECATTDYSVCGSSLPPAMALAGDPWSTFDGGLERILACPYGGAPSGTVTMRGACADGKEFLAYTSGSVRQTRFYRDGLLVGRTYDTDAGRTKCQCPFLGFQGTLDSVLCEQPAYEMLCDSDPPPPGYDPGFTPSRVCECNDPALYGAFR